MEPLEPIASEIILDFEFHAYQHTAATCFDLERRIVCTSMADRAYGLSLRLNVCSPVSGDGGYHQRGESTGASMDIAFFYIFLTCVYRYAISRFQG
jgi:hypothetical protein